MTVGSILRDFFHDDMVRWAFLLIALDFIFGAAAAFKAGLFRFSYVADFLRNDVLSKLAPFFALWFAGRFAPAALPLPGAVGDAIDLNALMYATYAILVTAWGASILRSLGELGLPVPGVPTLGGSQTVAVALGDENAAPPKD